MAMALSVKAANHGCCEPTVSPSLDDVALVEVHVVPLEASRTQSYSMVVSKVVVCTDTSPTNSSSGLRGKECHILPRWSTLSVDLQEKRN